MTTVLRVWLGLPLAGMLLALAAAAPWPAVASAGQPAPWPPALGASLEASLDDPQAALEPTRRLAEAAEGESRVWHWLAVARLEVSLEMDGDVAHSLQQAAAALAALPNAAPELSWWLEMAQLRQASVSEAPQTVLKPLAALRAQLPAGPSVLRCELLDIETWLLNEINSQDEAWRAAEAEDACAVETGWSFYRAQAALVQGQLAASDNVNPQAQARALDHFARADAAVGPGRGRYLRSLVAYTAGLSLAGLGPSDEALAQAQRALAISRDLGDRAGIAAALILMASIDLDLHRPAPSLPTLDEAESVLAALGDSPRLVRVQVLRLRAMTELRHAGLAAQLQRVGQLDLRGHLPDGRRRLVLAMADAQAALGRHAEAFASMKRALELQAQARQLGRDTQVLLLQARYDSARRDGEIAALKHREDAALLTLQAQSATQRGLWAALVALAVLLAAAGVLGWRAWRSRRELADLALRDELTGLPNRRAIEAYARAQLLQSQRLGLPFTLVLLDLDHFKSINDRFGHRAGDAMLKALARVTPQVLRAPDRLGRWGGEEFMLVLPGTRGDEIGGVFARLLSAFAVVDVAGMPTPHGVSFSMGGVEAGPHDTVDALLSQADERLYAAKDAGRSTWR